MITLEPKAYLFLFKIAITNLVGERLAWVLARRARKDRKLLAQRENLLVLDVTGVYSSPFDSRSENHAVSKVEGLKLRITAHKHLKNKFDQIRAGIKFIYFRDRLRCILTDKHAMFDRQFRTCSFFHAAMQANVFSIDKTHQHILFWHNIHSFVSIQSQLNTLVPLSVFIIESVAHNYLFSDSKVSGTIARKTGSLHVHVFGLRPICAINFSRDQSSNKLINFLDSRLDPRFSSIESRGSRDCQLTFERYCMLWKVWY